MNDKTEPLDGEDLINYTDVTARIAYLESCDCRMPGQPDFPCAGGYECATCDETARSELEDLWTLAADMASANQASGRASAIRDSYLEEFVQDEADNVGAIEREGHVWSYVKWDELTADRATEMEATTFRGTTYYITT